MKRPICAEVGCQAHAWHGGYCSYHAFLLHRTPNAKLPSERTQPSTPGRAEELGTRLAERVAAGEAAGPRADGVGGTRKSRSPVG